MAITYDDAHGWREWWPNDMAALWDALRGQRIVGWNVIGFDVPVIQQAVRNLGAPDPALDAWFALDLLAEIRDATGRWYKLEEVAHANLGRGKSGDGQQAAEWLRSGDPALVGRAVGYCMLDVQLVIDLHEMARTSGLTLPPRERDEDQSVLRWSL